MALLFHGSDWSCIVANFVFVVTLSMNIRGGGVMKMCNTSIVVKGAFVALGDGAEGCRSKKCRFTSSSH